MKEQYIWIKETLTECIYYAEIVSTNRSCAIDDITTVYCNFIIGNWKYFSFVGTMEDLKDNKCHVCLLGPSNGDNHFGYVCYDFDKLNVWRITSRRLIILY